MNEIQPTERYIGRCFWLDTNRINASGRLPNVTQLERWRDDGVITLELSEVAQTEAMAGGNPQRSLKALTHVTWGTTVDAELAQRIETILFPNGARNQNKRNDVLMVAMAMNCNACLVTADGASRTQPHGILGSRAALASLGVQVMTDDEAVAHVRDRIAVRDKVARYKAQKLGVPLPEWVGKD